jgi:hypothetical protein
MRDLAEARHLLKSSTAEVFDLVYDTPDALSQLIRTALVPSEGRVFAVADYSAIEARVLAWLADERWRLDVFASHGKIYEASASRMFNVPMEQIGKGSDLRQKGKVAELALGYQGSVGALKTMGGERMGLSEQDMSVIVDESSMVDSMLMAELMRSSPDAALQAALTWSQWAALPEEVRARLRSSMMPSTMTPRPVTVRRGWRPVRSSRTRPRVTSSP